MSYKRIAVVVVALIAAYYGFIFWYADSHRRAIGEHLLWTYPLRGGEDLCADPLADGTVVASANRRLVWVNSDGTHRASYAEESANDNYWNGYGYCWAAGAGNLCFVSSSAGEKGPIVHAVDSNGISQWHVELAEYNNLRALAYSDAAMYAVDDGGLLSRFTLAGKREWILNSGIIVSYLDISSDGHAYLSGTANTVPTNTTSHAAWQDTLACFSPEGKEVWRAKLPSPLVGNPLALDDGSVRCIGYDGALYAFDNQGQQLWKYQPPNPTGYMSSGGGGGIGSIIRDIFDPGTGYGAYGMYGYVTPLLSGDNTCYLWGDTVYCVGPDGKQRWSRQLGGDPFSAASGDNGTVYVASQEHGLVAIGPNGDVRWHNRGVEFISSAPSVGPDGRVYLEADQKLYCFEP